MVRLNKIIPITNINIDKAIEEYKNLFILLNIRLLLSTLILNYIKHKVNIQICYICLNIFPFAYNF